MTRAIAQRLGVPATRDAFDAIEPAVLVREQTAIAAGGSPLGGAPTVALAIGGDAVPRDPLTALIDGAGREIPVMIGCTSEEYRLWFVPSGALGTVRRSTLTLARIAARVPARIVRAHRSRRPEALPGEVLGEIMSDLLLRGPLTRFADSRTDAAAPTYVYEFRWRSALDGMGAAHAMELGFVFDTLAAPDSIALGGPDAPQSLADVMHGAWVGFVIDGEPGWERWSKRRPVQAFDADGGHIDYAPRAEELAGLPAR
jgi:para-nitrobenzyl esterase